MYSQDYYQLIADQSERVSGQLARIREDYARLYRWFEGTNTYKGVEISYYLTEIYNREELIQRILYSLYGQCKNCAAVDTKKFRRGLLPHTE